MTRASEPVHGGRNDLGAADRGSAAVTRSGPALAPPTTGPVPAAGNANGRSRAPVRRHQDTPGAGARRRRAETRLVALLFLGPALVLLMILVCYPIVYTIWLSLHDSNGTTFIGLDNYVRMFTSAETRRAITNNVVWVVVAPTIVTVLGLIFAVLTERLRRATALKLILFMPMAISFLAAGVTFRLVYDESPDRGALNAAIVSVHDVFAPPSVYHGVNPRDEGTLVAADGGFQTAAPVSSAGPTLLPLVGLPAERVPAAAAAAAAPSAGTGLRGVVWLDFTRGGGGTAGAIDPADKGLPGLNVQAVKDGVVVATTTTNPAGQYAFADLTGGGYTIRLAADNFTEPFQGLTWLGPNLVTPAVIGAYIWIWAGFAMVLISAGLAAMPREALEAARVDGATEWQVFRLVTIPLVRPVLVVVLVTLTINVLKIFDLVYVLAPDSSQDDANVVALEMYRVSFGGGLDYGLGSALAVLLFVLVLPAMLFNVRRMRRDAKR
jgi:alpha-glucoside transport system permease protein